MQVWLKFSICRPGVVCHNKHWSTENAADAKRLMYEFECEGGDGKAIVVAAGSGAEGKATRAVASDDAANLDPYRYYWLHYWPMLMPIICGFVIIIGFIAHKLQLRSWVNSRTLKTY